MYFTFSNCIVCFEFKYIYFKAYFIFTDFFPRIKSKDIYNVYINIYIMFFTLQVSETKSIIRVGTI